MFTEALPLPVYGELVVTLAISVPIGIFHQETVREGNCQKLPIWDPVRSRHLGLLARTDRGLFPARRRVDRERQDDVLRTVRR